MNANLTRLWRLGESFLDAERDDLENKQTDKTTYEKKNNNRKKQSLVHSARVILHII